MESLFSRLFKYRSSDKRVQQENFLTEIFAFLLKNPALVAAFLNECGVAIQGQPENIKIDTQQSFSTYPERIQPDIFVRFFVDNQKWLVFIENKVGAREGENQLDRYLGYLSKEVNKDTNCALLYLTRYYDPKLVDPPLGVIFKPIRWGQVYSILAKFEDNVFVSQARLFMEENNLSLSRDFSTNEITAMMHWNTVRTMMDNSLEEAQERLKQITGIKRLYQEDVGDYLYIAGKSLAIEIGYYLEDIAKEATDEDFPYVGSAIVVYPEHRNREQITSAFMEFEKKGRNWKLRGDPKDKNDEIWVEKLLLLKEFMKSKDHISSIQQWFLKEILPDIEEFLKDNPYSLN